MLGPELGAAQQRSMRKRCVFVESPSSAGIRRALIELAPIQPAAVGDAPEAT